MDELVKSFYSDFSKNRAEDDIEELSNPFLNIPQIPKLAKMLRNICIKDYLQSLNDSF